MKNYVTSKGFKKTLIALSLVGLFYSYGEHKINSFIDKEKDNMKSYQYQITDKTKIYPIKKEDLDNLDFTLDDDKIVYSEYQENILLDTLLCNQVILQNAEGIEVILRNFNVKDTLSLKKFIEQNLEEVVIKSYKGVEKLSPDNIEQYKIYNELYNKIRKKIWLEKINEYLERIMKDLDKDKKIQQQKFKDIEKDHVIDSLNYELHKNDYKELKEYLRELEIYKEFYPDLSTG